MKRILLLLLYWTFLSPDPAAAQRIVGAEYFIDTDPGPGRGTRIQTATPGNFRFNLPLDGLQAGNHVVGIRVLDERGAWSLTDYRPFLVTAGLPAPPRIVAAEYFFNTDPGAGRGTPLPVNTPGQSISQSTAIPIGSLPPGCHLLHIRTRNSEGHWSLFDTRSFCITDKPLLRARADTIRLCQGDTAGLRLDYLQPADSVRWFRNEQALPHSQVADNFYEAEDQGVYRVVAFRGNDRDTSNPITIRVDNGPDTALRITPDSLVCGDGPALLELKEQEFVDVQWYRDNDLLTGETAFTLTTTEPGRYRARLSGQRCANETRTVFIRFAEAAIAPSVTYANGQLSADVSGGQLQWYRNGSPVNGATSSNHRPARNGTYQLKITNAGGCAAWSNAIEVTEWNEPALLLNPPAPSAFCAGSEVTLNFRIEGGGYEAANRFRLQLSDAAGSFRSPRLLAQLSVADTSAISGLLPTDLPAGRYRLRLTASHPQTVSDTLELDIRPLPAVTITGPATLCPDAPATLTARYTGDDLRWSTGAATPSVELTRTGMYYVTATNSCGSARDSVQLQPGICGVYVPNAFSPNGDGRNDEFRPLTQLVLRDYQFRIFNRNGEVIFAAAEPGRGWDGRFRGQLQPSSVYLWTLQYTDPLSGERATQKGTVLLVR